MKLKILVLAIAAACGGSSSKPAPVAPTPEPPTVAEPAPPTEPEKPSEPAPPPEPPAPDPEKIKADLLATETVAFEKAKPVFDKFCMSCHVKGQKNATAKKLKQFDMSSYPFGGEHAAEIAKEVREVLAIGGGKAKMPKGKPGSVKGDDLALIAAWADAWDAAHAGGAHAK